MSGHLGNRNFDPIVMCTQLKNKKGQTVKWYCKLLQFKINIIIIIFIFH